MKKQTAVDFLVDKWSRQGTLHSSDCKQALEIEKQHIENAYWDGGQDIPLTEKRCEQYYNETFKSK